MEKRISYYKLKKPLDSWPEKLLRQYEKHYSGLMVFEEGSEEEKEFIRMAEEIACDMSRNTILKCTGKDLYRHPFHYLCVYVTRKIVYVNDFVDYSNACHECRVGSARIGGRQIEKIVLDYNSMKPYDIMTLSGHVQPKLFLISRKLRMILETQGFTGYETVPCLDKGEEYSEQDRNINLQNEELERRAKYFQLIITEEAINPPYVGEVNILVPPCPNCKSANAFLTSNTPTFYKSDLRAVDFQITNNYYSSNYGTFCLGGEIPIISSNVLKCFLENKVKLIRYMTHPLIQYGVVEIQEEKMDTS